MKKISLTKSSIIGAVAAAITASLCCVGPLLLLTLGVSGAWIGTLTHLGFLRPIGVIITGFFLILAFWKLYITPKRCMDDKPCANSNNLKTQRIVFWIITILVILLLAFPWYAHLFY